MKCKTFLQCILHMLHLAWLTSYLIIKNTKISNFAQHNLFICKACEKDGTLRLKHRIHLHYRALHRQTVD